MVKSLNGTVIGVFTPNGYNSVEYTWQAGQTFQIGDFGASILTNDPVRFSIPVEIIDADGDVATGPLSVLDITVKPAAIPVVLDLDGDGAEFLSTAAGVTFDYAGDGTSQSTAWVGSDDGLLAFDRNGDGIVNDGSEIVFGGNGLTDLQALAANYDSNRDGQLTSADDNFALFGVWQDANSNGVTDAGEFRSLSDAGIVKIGLVSDGVSYSAAGGDVSVAGQSTYTKADGSTGIVADAAFATGAAQSAASRSTEQLRTTNTTSSIIAASLVGLAAEANPASAISSDMQGTKLAQFEYLPTTGGSEPFIIATVQQDRAEMSSTPSHDFVLRTGDVASSVRAVEADDIVSGITQGPALTMSELLGDSGVPRSVQGTGSMSAFGGDSVMHNMLDMAAFAPSMSANDNPAIPMSAGDAIRGAMPDMMMDRLIESFDGDLGPTASSGGGASDNSDYLLDLINQNVSGSQDFARINVDPMGLSMQDVMALNNP